MGRSKHDYQASVYSRSERSTRRRDVNNGETSETFCIDEGKWALYHCNNCNKNISNQIRVKCAVCPDFDLCVECFSVGAEVSPHRSNHPYMVTEAEDELAFPITCPDWNARDEMLLLEGVEVYGLEYWAEVAEHVGRKSIEQCRDHYKNVYLNSPDFLPDLSHLVGKNRDDLILWAKSHDKEMKESSGTSNVAATTLNKTSVVSQAKDECSIIGDRTRKRGQRKKQKLSGDERRKNRPSCGERRKKVPGCDEKSTSPWPEGYNPQRHEFETEYDDDAEKLLSEMEFKDTDTKEEHELKLRVLHIYSKRLDERNRRKDFLQERNLLRPSDFEQNLSPEEREICRRYDLFMRLHPKEEHDDLLQTVIQEHRIRKRLAELKEARAAGCRTTAEADIYLEQRRNFAVDGSSIRARVPSLITPGSGGEPAQQSNSKPFSHLHQLRVSSADLLNEAEKQLCSECSLQPHIYLKIQEMISIEIFKGNITTKSDTRCIPRINTNTLERIYDILARKGNAPP